MELKILTFWTNLLSAILLTVVLCFPQKMLYAQDSISTAWLPNGISLTDLTWSKDGSIIAVASDNGIWVRESSNKQVQKVTNSGANSIALDPINFFIAYDADKTIHIYDLREKSNVLTLEGHTLGINKVIFSLGGNILVSASQDKTVRIWDIKKGSEINALLHDSEVTSVALSSDERLLASGTHSGTIYVWSMDYYKIKYIIKGHLYSVNDITFSPNGTLIATASDDETTRLWDARTGVKLATFSSDQLKLPQYTQGPVNRVAFSPDGSMLATGTRSLYEHIRIWNIRTGQQFAIIENSPAQDIVGLRFSADSSKLIELDKLAARFWDIKNQEQIGIPFAVGKDKWDMFLESFGYFDLASLRNRTKRVYGDPIASLSISSNMKYLLVGRANNTPELRDIDTGDVLWKLSGHTNSVMDVALSPNGKYALTGGLDGAAILWDLQTQKIVYSFADTHAVWAIAFSPDSKYLLIARGSVELWRLSDFTLIFETFVDFWTTTVSFSPDGHYGLLGGWGGIAYIWDLKTGDIVQALPYSGEISSLRFSPNGKYIVAGGNKISMLWDVQSGKEIQLFVGNNANITSVGFAPDSTSILTGSEDGTVRLWDIKSGNEMKLYSPAGGKVNSVLFSPNGQFIIIGCADGSISVWDLNAFLIAKF